MFYECTCKAYKKKKQNVKDTKVDTDMHVPSKFMDLFVKVTRTVAMVKMETEMLGNELNKCRHSQDETHRQK